MLVDIAKAIVRVGSCPDKKTRALAARPAIQIDFASF